MCLSNPAGPTAVAQCVPPITKLWRHLSLGHAFPTCDMDNGQNHYAQHEWATARNCPDGYQLPGPDGEILCRMKGVVTVILNGAPVSRTWWGDEGTVVEGASSRAQLSRLPVSDERGGQ